ncbi:uroporphyrinogen-III C-methyltransferase [Oleomonas cavernae]|uniref:uroporphyrinogen-III C-methyltransferase n=1 Tax=Oleomonas cavernae TaxID=2320859 RepID=A0A418VU01_9PROT|nr:uroporphyrinogen-III C-methyltransferase [Oleomonas cavernae]RJF80616.1 uroporphyrinogen-III C-methyltransferase [Oleomonas cavernae]
MPTPSRKPVEVRLIAGGIPAGQEMPARGPGSVTLVGAGPGDAELLTIKALKALQAAEVVLFDDLVAQEVLDLVHAQARCLAVGKRGGRESCAQGDINDLMVRFAKAGKRVVRLKCGDPMIFGRAGEEIARLQAEGIAVEVIPGITSASAMAAACKVSLTHRDHAQSVRFVTGHSRHGTLPDNLDWQGLADARTSLVIYMGGRTAGDLVAKLTAAGLSLATPAIAVRAVTRPDEKRWHGTLADLAQGVAGLGLEHPLLIGIGNAFAAAQAIDLACFEAALQASSA